MTRAVAVLAATLVAVAGCGAGGSGTAATPVQGRTTVGIGDGRTVDITCEGNGSPAVVLISGSRNAADAWSRLQRPGASGFTAADLEAAPAAVLPQLAATTTTCAYDRPGTVRLDGTPSGTSRVPQPTTAAAGVADLQAALQAAGVPPPYVLVAHSWGGMIALLHQAAHPDEVAGTLLLDPASPALPEQLTRDQWAAFLRTVDAADDGSGLEAPDYRGSILDVGAAVLRTSVLQGGALAAGPTTVITADQEFEFGAGPGTWTAWLRAQDQLAAQLRARHVTASSSGHLVALENPALVVEEARTLVEAARDRDR